MKPFGVADEGVTVRRQIELLLIAQSRLIIEKANVHAVDVCSLLIFS